MFLYRLHPRTSSYSKMTTTYTLLLILSMTTTLLKTVSGETTTYLCSGTQPTSPLSANTPSGILQLSENDLSKCEMTIPSTAATSDTSKLEINLNIQQQGSAGLISDVCLVTVSMEDESNCITEQNSTLTLESFISSTHIKFTDYALQSGAQLSISYTIYEDICVTKSADAYPLIMRDASSQFSSENQCGMRLDVSTTEAVFITAESTHSSYSLCDMNNMIKIKRVSTSENSGSLICKGLACLARTGLDVTDGIHTLRVLYSPSRQCSFTWKFVALSSQRQQDICSLDGADLTLPHMKITSPGYPAVYESNYLNCTVSLSKFEVVVVTTQYMSLRKASCMSPINNNPCRCGDHLIVNNTATCGVQRKKTNAVYYSRSLPLQISLITQEQGLGSYKGVVMSYQGYNGATDICQITVGTILPLPALLKSPSFPANYPDNRTCQAIMGVEGQRRINVKVISFAVEFNKRCDFDFLSLNGRKFCGSDPTTIPTAVNVTRHLNITFRSDGNMAKSGFYIYLDEDEAVNFTTTTASTTEATPVTLRSTESQPPTASTTGTTKTTATTKPHHLATTTVENMVYEIDSSTETTVISTSITPSTMAQGKLIDPVSSIEITTRQTHANQRLTESNTAHRITVLQPTGNTPSVISYRVPSVDDSPAEHNTNKPARDSENSESSNVISSVPWYFWICALIAILLAVLITMTVFLIKLKKLKVAIADGEGSRDGLANPMYYRQTPVLNYNNHLNNNTSSRDIYVYPFDDLSESQAGSPNYNNWDRNPLSTFKGQNRRIINKNSTQTTV